MVFSFRLSTRQCVPLHFPPPPLPSSHFQGWIVVIFTIFIELRISYPRYIVMLYVSFPGSQVAPLENEVIFPDRLSHPVPNVPHVSCLPCLIAPMSPRVHVSCHTCLLYDVCKVPCPPCLMSSVSHVFHVSYLPCRMSPM